MLKETIRQEQDKVQRLAVQYDNEHDWALKRIEEEKDSHRLQTQQEMLSYRAETKRSKQDLELLQAKFDVAITMNEQNRDRITDTRAQYFRGKIKAGGSDFTDRSLTKRTQ